MAGISDKALKTQYVQNKYRYNGKELQNQEFSDGSGLEAYDASARMYDPQIGRFWQQDPLADIFENWSPYSFANNNPILLNDPIGDSVVQPTIIVTQGNNHSGAELANTKGGAPNVTAGPAPETAAAPVTGSSSSTAAIPIAITIGTLGGEAAGGVSVSAIGAAALPALVVGVIAYSAYALLTMPQNIPAPRSIPNGDISIGIPKPYIPESLTRRLSQGSGINPPAYPGNDPAVPPGQGWVWRGPPGSIPGSDKGAWYNPGTKETLHPDLDHPAPVGPHWDWRAPDGEFHRLYPDGRVEPR